MKKLIKKLLSYLYRILKSSYNDTVYEEYRKKYEINESFRFNGEGIAFNGDGRIKIGKNSYMGVYSSIQSVKGQKVSIGDNCSISHNVKIYTLNYDANEIINKETNKLRKRGDVIIGNNCWIGVNVLIVQGVTIGSNVVIGGNSVIVKDIPSNCVVGGIPAKIIKNHDNKK